MFTGIVTDVGMIVAVAERDNVRRIAIESAFDADTVAIGASIACAGICLTAISCKSRAGGGSVFEVDVAPETLLVTSAGDWKGGTRLNLERSLRIGDELGGHIVSGHVDGIRDDRRTRGTRRSDTFHIRGTGASRAVHRTQGLGCTGWDLADGERRFRQPFRLCLDPAYPESDHLERAPEGRWRSPRSRSDRALCCAAG